MNAHATSTLRTLTLSLVLAAGGATAVAQDAAIDPPSTGDLDEFRYYFSITTDPYERQRGNNWSDQLSFDTDILSRDFVILYEGQTGRYPTAGPHLTMRDGYMDAHLAQLEIDIERQIPDPEFSGLAIIDYEDFRAIWDRTPNVPSDEGPDAHDTDFQDDWRDYIRSVNPEFDGMSGEQQEQHLRETYEAAVRDFFLATLNKGREMRPNAKWGFYGYPLRFYKWKREAPTSVISYDDGSHAGSRFNDRLQWMWDAVDVITPSVYPAMAVANPDEYICQRQYTAQEEWEYLKNMLRESERVGKGKPVLPFITSRYYLPKDCLQWEDLREVQLENQIFGPAHLGADGAILWGDLNCESDMIECQAMLDTRIMPLMTQAVTERQDQGNGRSDDGGKGMAKGGGKAKQDGGVVGHARRKPPEGRAATGQGKPGQTSGGGVVTQGNAPGIERTVSRTEAKEALRRARRHFVPERKPE